MRRVPWVGMMLAGVAIMGCESGEAAPAARDTSPGETERLSVDIPPVSVHRPTSLDDLDHLLQACPDPTSTTGQSACPHLVYLWTPQMPLSESGMGEIELAASAMGVPLSILPADAVTGVVAASSVSGTADPAPEERNLRHALIEAGATVHYPSIVLFDGISPWGTAVAGHKKAQGYRALLEPRIAALSAGEEPRPTSTAPRAAVSGPPEFGAMEVVWRQTMNPPPGFFFRRVPGTRFISYDQRKKVILQHLETGEKLLGPGFIDFVPTPDGALFVTPSHSDGLEFYIAGRVFSEARAGRGADVEPVFRDPELDDQYPSVGILDDDPGVSTTYRILVSWFEGLAVREYRVKWGEAGDASVTPTTPRIDACPGMALSTPILSKDGQEIAARDEATGTTKLFRYHDDGSCTEVFDFGIPTSKVGFSDDGRLIAYSTPDGTTGTSTTWVHERASGGAVRIPESTSRGLMIPEFVGPDSLLFIVAEGVRGGPQEFRMVCCV